MAQALAEKLEHTGPAEKETSGLSASERAVDKYARAVGPVHQIVREERIKVRKSRTLARERKGSERVHGEKKVEPTVKKGEFQGSEGGQARRASLEEA